MKKIMLFMAMMMATSCFAQAPMVQPIFRAPDDIPYAVSATHPMPVYINSMPSNWPTEVSASNPLPITGDLEIGSVTVDVFPVYSDASGNPATATVDANNRAIINIGSDSVGIKTSVDTVKTSVDTVKTAVDLTTTAVGNSTLPSNYVATRTITLVANTAQAITTALPAGTTREFITISAMDIEKDFWLQFGGTVATVSQCMLVNGRVSLPLRGGVDISVIASTAFDLYILEGGKQ